MTTGSTSATSTITSAHTGDTGDRLQQIIVVWRGADRGQPIVELHQACVTAAGPDARKLLPAQVVLVDDVLAPFMDEAGLELIAQALGIPRPSRANATISEVSGEGEEI